MQIEAKAINTAALQISPCPAGLIPEQGATTHSSIRSQQRGIPPLIIDLLMQFGTRGQGSGGAEILYFDRRARAKVAAYAGGLIGKLNEHLDAYAVVACGKIITVGTRYQRIKQA